MGQRARKSFFKTLKRELVNGKGRKTREEAKQDVFEYIASYYNRQRIHSSVGHNAPMRPRARCCLKKLIVPSKFCKGPRFLNIKRSELGSPAESVLDWAASV